MRWIAYMLQKPWETPEVAIAFRGEEGTGKGTLGRALMRIAGQHGLTVSHSAQFTGRFNSHLRNCVFLFADEAVWPGDKAGEGILKQLVTEPVLSYEAKVHFDHFLRRNTLRAEKATHKALATAGRKFGLLTGKADGGTTRTWKLPRLDEARDTFQRRMGITRLFD